MEQQQTEQPADSPRPYVFDFNAEVESARAEYPEETGNVRMFLLPNDENALRQTDEWELIAKLGSQFISGDYNRPAMLILKLGAGDRLLDDPEKDAFFTFWHELGHAIITRGLLDDGGYPSPSFALEKGTPEYWKAAARERKREEAADVFVAVQSLRRGILTPDGLRQLSGIRAYRFLCQNDLSHYTSPGLDSTIRKDFSLVALTPCRIAAFAASIPSMTPMSGESLEKLSTAFKECKGLPATAADETYSPTQQVQKASAEDHRTLRDYLRRILEDHPMEDDPAHLAAEKIASFLNCSSQDGRMNAETAPTAGPKPHPPTNRHPMP